MMMMIIRAKNCFMRRLFSATFYGTSETAKDSMSTLSDSPPTCHCSQGFLSLPSFENPFPPTIIIIIITTTTITIIIILSFFFFNFCFNFNPFCSPFYQLTILIDFCELIKMPHCVHKCLLLWNLFSRDGQYYDMH